MVSLLRTLPSFYHLIFWFCLCLAKIRFFKHLPNTTYSLDTHFALVFELGISHIKIPFLIFTFFSCLLILLHLFFISYFQSVIVFCAFGVDIKSLPSFVCPNILPIPSKSYSQFISKFIFLSLTSILSQFLFSSFRMRKNYLKIPQLKRDGFKVFLI